MVDGANPRLERERRDQDTQTSQGDTRSARRAGTARLLLLVVLWLLVGLYPSPVSAARRDKAAPTAVPFPSLHWKALLLAGDDSIGAFDHAIDALATLWAQHHTTVVQRFSTNPTLLSTTVRLATVANLRAAIPLLQVQPGEGCLLYATSHGTPEGLLLARDPASGYRLRPTQLHQVVQAACGEAPTILVLSGCYTGTFVRDPLRSPNRIILTAAAADRPSFGCAAEAPYTYYDRCFLQAFATVPTWQALHQTVTRCVAAAERQLRARPSHPQAFFGRWMAEVPIPPP